VLTVTFNDSFLAFGGPQRCHESTSRIQGFIHLQRGVFGCRAEGLLDVRHLHISQDAQGRKRLLGVGYSGSVCPKPTYTFLWLTCRMALRSFCPYRLHRGGWILPGAGSWVGKSGSYHLYPMQIHVSPNLVVFLSPSCSIRPLQGDNWGMEHSFIREGVSFFEEMRRDIIRPILSSDRIK
jgi:hypothetical protein